eukprot:gnl/MRDRNA2_/MRDRNA2_129950_c0_seq1.p1 gnl/MRDRNA2_/MRDRNA2_129950_c0~~gnl/MRDRNA2_/MRDRNA2_129950_c0_seq1.p1  ORF type:complete len:402 (-),score=49.13 gnl/MRDRNA2_/MRDRNA2_129950_c0_seq1:88-1293(-)
MANPNLLAVEAREVLVTPTTPSINEGQLQCRVCMEYGGEDLIQPCLCTGSVQWIHRRCLDKWRVSGSNVRAFTHCPQCGFAYIMSLVRAPTEHEQDIRKRRRRLLRHSVRNFVLLSCGIQVALCLLAMLIRAIDQKEVLVTFFNLPWNNKHFHEGDDDFWNSLRHYKSTYYLAACLLSLFVLGVGTTLAACLRGCCGCCPSSVHCPLENCHCNNDPFLNYLACRDCGQCCGDCCEFCGRCDCPDCPSPGTDCCPRGGSAPSGGSDDGRVCAVMIAAVVVLFILVGFMLAMATCITWMQNVVQKYYQLRELRLLTGEYLVQDLSKLPLPPSMLTASSSVLQASAPPQEGPMEEVEDLSNWAQNNAAPSAPPASLDWAVVPMTSSTVQQSLTMDLQAIYGYQV